MRLKSLLISGFRGLPIPQYFDFDADAIIITGPNGSGKTSLFDALLWGLTGSVQRIHANEAELVSKYSPTGEARVEITLGRETGSDLRVTRRFDGSPHLSVEAEDIDQTTGSTAETVLLDSLWPEARFAADPQVALSRSLTRSAYLQQDLVAQFVQAGDVQERFQIVSELVGVGRVEELQRQLEGSRNNWSKATNTFEREQVAPLRQQLATIRDQLGHLASLDDRDSVPQTFQQWQQQVAALLPKDESQALVEPSAQSLDRALSSLQTLQLREERRVSTLQRLLQQLEVPQSSELLDVSQLEARVHAAEALRQAATERVEQAQSAAAAERRRQIEHVEQAESYRTLAELALQHLSDRCPVCDQVYDLVATQARLEEVVGQGPTSLAVCTDGDPVREAAAQLEAADTELAQTRTSLGNALAAVQARQTWEESVQQLAREAEVSVSASFIENVRQLLAVTTSRIETVQQCRSVGEALSIQLARMAELAQRAELEQQIQTLARHLEMSEVDLSQRTATGELASTLFDALREANEKIVGKELAKIEPLLQRIFAQVDPHPSFRAVTFLTRTTRGRGKLWTTVKDEVNRVSVDEPSRVLSSSQLNVLAVTTFLSLNLAVPSLPLQLVALDDPLQSLDTVNLLGLADLLRRIKRFRQVIVSAHDDRLANLLTQKLRPVATGQRTCEIRLDGWTREGPTVVQHDVPADVPPLRLVRTA